MNYLVRSLFVLWMVIMAKSWIPARGLGLSQHLDVVILGDNFIPVEPIGCRYYNDIRYKVKGSISVKDGDTSLFT